MTAILPRIGTRGLYRLLAPFDNVLMPGIPYTCIALRRLTDIIASGDNPEDLYYTPKQLGSDIYAVDLNNNASIVTLQSDSGTIAYVPSTYIDGYPNTGGIPYKNILLAINLGPIPDSMDLSIIQSKLAATVREYLGIESKTEVVVASDTAIISNDKHAMLESVRASRISAVSTDYSNYLKAASERDEAVAKLRQLELYVKTLPQVLPPVSTP